VRRNRFLIILGIFLVLFSLPYFADAKRLYTFGVAQPIQLDLESKCLSSYDSFNYCYKSNGIFSIWKNGLHQGDMSFGVFGTVNEEPQKKLMTDFDWTWQVIENNEEVISVKGYNNYENFQWWIDLNIYQYRPLKITHTITNNLGQSIENAQLFYILDVNQENQPFIYYEKLDGTIYQYDYSTDWHFTNQSVNFEDYYNRVRLGNFQFLFQDLIDSDFFITRTFFGNLSSLDATLPNTSGFALSFSKGNQTISDGMTIVSDPNLTILNDDLDGRLQETITAGSRQFDTTQIQIGLPIYPPAWINRGLLKFNLPSFGKIKDANFYLFFRTNSYTDTNNYDANLTSIQLYLEDPSFYDWTSPAFETIDSNWLQMSHNYDNNANITTAWNNAVSANRNYLALSIQLNKESELTTDDLEGYIAFCDTGATTGLCTAGTTDPYLEYDPFVDVNIQNPNGSNYYFPSSDINQLIDFNVLYEDSNNLYASLWYSTTGNGQDNIIIADINLLDMAVNPTVDLNCTWDITNFAQSQKCSVDWNAFGITDGNYFIDLNIWDYDDESYFNNDSSDSSFYLDSTAPTTIWDANELWQNSDVNVHLTCVDAGACSGGDSNLTYRLDSDSSNGVTYGSWLTYDTNILITGDGNWAIDFNSTDYVGNIGDVNTFYVLIDSVNPTTSNLTPATNTDTTQNEPTFTIDVSDALSGLSFCHYEVFKNNAPIYSGTETATAGTCSHKLDSTYALAIDQNVLIQWDVNDLAGNVTADENSFSYTRIESGGEGGGGGTSPTFVFVETQKVFTISVPDTSQLIFDVYPEYKKFEKFSLKNDLDSNQLLNITVSEEIYPYLKFDENSSEKLIEFAGLEQKDILYVVDIPENAQIGKYFGTITLQDANRTTEIQVTINITDKPIWAFATEWIQSETLGIPNLVLVVAVIISAYLIY